MIKVSGRSKDQPVSLSAIHPGSRPTTHDSRLSFTPDVV
jgi:hypothetical protein